MENEVDQKQSKIIDYDILVSTSVDNLIDEVKIAISKGWTPLGGVVSSSFVIIQSLVKYENNA